MRDRTLGIAIIGSGGSGALTAGKLLLEAAARGGWYGLLTRSVGAQIRGGEAAAMLRLGSAPVRASAAVFDLLIALDWQNVERFAEELVLDARSVVLADPGAGAMPEVLARHGARCLELPFAALAKAIAGARRNMIGLGAAAALLGLPEGVLIDLLPEAFARKGAEVVATSEAAVRAGMQAAGALDAALPLPPPDRAPGARRWVVSGNQAAGLGALRGGVRFAAGYPITPATDLLEWLAPALARVGGALVQAEDELASINMVIGASFGGTPALTATSGPGLALMTESLGLAVAAEIPLVLVDVMRGGPSTGIPTKSEQSDLNIAVYGLHGDAPHLVLAPTDVADCLFTTQWAVHLAERLQVPAIVLSDQFLGQANAVVDEPPEVDLGARRETAQAAAAPYRRYALGECAVSPMALPGLAEGRYTADGLAHDERGSPSSRASDHLAQLEKRQAKLECFDYGAAWADVEGEGELAVIAWGATVGAAREALTDLAARGVRARLLALRLLAPLRVEAIEEALRGVTRVLVVEQTHSGQFHRYLRAHLSPQAEWRALHHPGPATVRPAAIRDALLDWPDAPAAHGAHVPARAGAPAAARG